MLLLSPQTLAPCLLGAHGAPVIEEGLLAARLGRAASGSLFGVLLHQQAIERGGTLRNQASRVWGTRPGNGVEVGAAGLWGTHTAAFLQRVPWNATEYHIVLGHLIVSGTELPTIPPLPGEAPWLCHRFY